MSPIAEIALDLSYTDTKVWARVYAPMRAASDEEWSCSFEISEPLAIERTIYGGSSLQALMLALKAMSSYLYGSEAYEKKQLGIGGEFGGNLSIPAPSIFLDAAPFPF